MKIVLVIPTYEKNDKYPSVYLLLNEILMETLWVIPNIFYIYNHWISTIGFSSVKEYFNITKIRLSSIMRVRLKRKFKPDIEDKWQNNHFKYFLIKMQFSRASYQKN